MNQSQNQDPAQEPTRPSSETDALTEQQLADLANPAKQEEYRQAYLEQQRRRACPGCGDDGIVY